MIHIIFKIVLREGMYTFTTKDFLVQIRRRGTATAAVAADSGGLNEILVTQFERCAQVNEASRKAARDARLAEWRDRQTRFFAAFQRPVPDDAVEHPLEVLEFRGYPFLYSNDYGYSLFHPGCDTWVQGDQVYAGPNAILAGRLARRGTTSCDKALVAPWLTELIHDFGKMVFHTALEFKPSPRIDAVCEKFGLPLSAARFSKAREQKEMFAFRLKMDGAVVPVYADRLGPTELPERLTPWSVAVLARPDAHAILSEIARVLND